MDLGGNFVKNNSQLNECIEIDFFFFDFTAQLSQYLLIDLRNSLVSQTIVFTNFT